MASILDPIGGGEIRRDVRAASPMSLDQAPVERVTLNAVDPKYIHLHLESLARFGASIDGDALIRAGQNIKASQAAKIEEEARKRLKAAAVKYFDELCKTPRRFVVACAKEAEIIQAHEGVEYSDGRVYVNGYAYPQCGLYDSMKIYKERVEREGYSYHIEYED